MSEEFEKNPAELGEAVQMLREQMELMTERQMTMEKRLEDVTVNEEQNDEKKEAAGLDATNSKMETMNKELQELKTEFNNNVMFAATREGRVEDLKYLIERRALPISARSKNGNEDMAEELKKIREDLADVVEKLTLNMEMMTERQENVERRLEEASVKEGQVVCIDEEKKEAVDNLEPTEFTNERMDEELKGLKPEFHNNILFVAAREGRVEDLKFLVEQRGLPISARSKEGTNLLYVGIQSGNREITKYIVQRGAELNLDDKETKKLLVFACMKGDLNVIRYMHLNGVDLTVRDDETALPVHISSKHGHLDILKYLHLIGVDFTVRDMKGWAPIHFASQRGQLDVIHFLHQQGVDLSMKSNSGSTPLHYACLHCHIDVIKYLQAQGVDLSARNNDGWVPLHHGSEPGHLDVIKYLHQQGVDLSVTNNEGRMPLHIASNFGQLEAVKLLVELGADPKAVDKDGHRPVDYARYCEDQRRREAVIAFLTPLS